MKTNMKEIYFDNYSLTISKNIEKFTKPISNELLKEYGVKNNDFWKNYIVNINAIKNDDFLKTSHGFFKHLARLYFYSVNEIRQYYVERLFSVGSVDRQKVEELATELEKNGILVDKASAVLVDKTTNLYKFEKYKIVKE